MTKAIVILLLAGLVPLNAGTRLKELVRVEGVRDNQLIGYGLVVGLAGTGDRRQTVFPAQSLTNMLERMGVTVPPAAIQVSNTAAVMVTATLPPYAATGSRIDVTTAAMGDARNLQGGLLLLTPLKGADGRVYAVAQGPLVTGGFAAGGAGNTQTLNHPTVGRVPGGAIVETSPPARPLEGKIRLLLRQADFTTASRIAAAVNKTFPSQNGGTLIARAETPSAIVVDQPAEYAQRPIEFLAALEAVAVETDRLSKIVLNERTGTIVMGSDTRIKPVSILHGALTVQIETTFEVSQPAPFSKQGQTTVTPRVGVDAKEEKAKSVQLKEGSTVEDLARALTAIGSTARDIIAILQSLRAAGALDAEIEVI